MRKVIEINDMSFNKDYILTIAVSFNNVIIECVSGKKFRYKYSSRQEAFEVYEDLIAQMEE